jgi:GT2 family glycosyltransferase
VVARGARAGRAGGADTVSEPAYSIVIPTYKRPDMLEACLESICALDYPLDALEIVIVDNGGPAANSEATARPFASRLRIEYLVNERNRGYGFSVNRGMRAARGRRIMFLNDDARPQPDVLRKADELFDGDPLVGCIGCRAIETGYINSGDGIGRMDPSGEVVANFNVDCGRPVEVEHLYGFCYVFTREAFERAGANDETLLAKPYSSGDRIETDHCLSIRRSGLKVMYHPGMAARHLAKPRADYSEISLRWKLNSIRNTIYVYLKHFGPFGRRAAALRLTFLVDVGLISAIRHPSRANLAYLLNGLRARASAYGHYVLYLLSGPRQQRRA